MEATLIPPSLLAIPTLEPIPQSVAPTPALRESPPPGEAGPSNYQLVSEPHTPGASDADIDGPSRRSSISSYHPIPGSYFPAPSSSRAYYPASSNASTPSERPRPSPIRIPAGTPDEPLFSAYPNTGNGIADHKGKGRSFNFQLRPAFNLSHPGHRRRKADDGESSADEQRITPLAALARISHHGRSQVDLHNGSYSPPTSPSSRVRSHGRRRAATLSHSPTSEETPNAKHRMHHPDRGPSSARPADMHTSATPRSFRAFRRRRASVGHAPAPVATEFEPPGSGPTWPSMVDAVAQRFDPAPPAPFSYQQSANSQYTLQSVSTITTVRPLASPGLPVSADTDLPSIAPRRSSLHPGQTVLGLSNVAVAHGLPEPAVEIVMPDDMAMPHNPPPRRSSLDYGGSGLIEIEAPLHGIPPSPAVHLDGQSVLSASLTTTDTSASASADAFSPSGSSKEHPLSSATTSLSRSAKSGKEGSEEKDAALSALRLQRSLEWEARQTRHRRKLEHRKMVLLELVETEVAYKDDLKTLAYVYLPQLAALPSITERTSKMIARNTTELLAFHTELSAKMVEVLKEEEMGFGYTHGEPDIAGRVDRVSKSLAALFVEEIPNFALYKEFCAGSIVASTLVRHISLRPDYDAFERRCQFISASQPHTLLKDLLGEARSPGPLNRSRLHFKDYLITPIQRICRYPLLLGQLLDAVEPHSPTLKSEHESSDDDSYDIGVDIERALGAMRGVAEEADEARRLKDTEVKSATVLERFEPHSSLTPTFLRSLGTCRLIGSLDVLHHHPTVAPLLPPVKVKYLAAFLYRGYLILAKVKKGKAYEAKHFLPLEVFELIDITEGFLPHSIRLRLRDHNFDLAASCEAEKDVWAAAICEARDESNVPPFELPASVSPFAARPRRMSAASHIDLDTMAGAASVSMAATPSANKRHTLAGGIFEFGEMPTMTTAKTPDSRPTTPAASPLRTTFGFTPDRRAHQPGTILLRRASTNQRLLVDRGLLDIFSDSCSTARNKAQLHHALFLPDVPPEELRDGLSIRDSTLLRRRRSFLDSKAASFDIAFTGEIKGSVIQLRPTRSSAGRYRSMPSHGRRASSAVSVRGGAEDSADETATATANNSDFGTLRHDYTRSNSVASFSPAPTPQRSMSSLREHDQHTDREDGLTMRTKSKSLRNKNGRDSQSVTSNHLPALAAITSKRTSSLLDSKWRTSSTNNLNSRSRTGSRSMSMPTSPASIPQLGVTEEEVPPIPDMYCRTTAVAGQDTSAPAGRGRPWTPPLVRKGNSDQLYQSPRHRNKSAAANVVAGEYYIPPPHGVPLDTIGNNASLSSEINPTLASSLVSSISAPATAWGTLRRSMTFLPMRSRNSVTSMEDVLQSHSNSNSNSSSANSNEGHDSSVSTSAHGHNGQGESEDTDGPEPIRSGTVSAPVTPKRKKSLRLFGGGFKGFTPI